MNPRLSGATSKPMCSDMPDKKYEDAGGGLVGKALGVASILGQCHMIAETIRDAVLPPATRPGCGDEKMSPPEDLTTRLEDLHRSALELRDKLAGLRETLRG
jgi:hypothetical protein